MAQRSSPGGGTAVAGSLAPALASAGTLASPLSAEVDSAVAVAAVADGAKVVAGAPPLILSAPPARPSSKVHLLVAELREFVRYQKPGEIDKFQQGVREWVGSASTRV